MHAYSPTGSRITGTLERIPGVARIDEDSFRANGKGQIDFDWSGETKIDWDGQKTVLRKMANGTAQPVFVDEDGAEWLASQLILAEEDETEDTAATG